MGNRLFVNSNFVLSASRAMFWFLFRLNGIIIFAIKMIYYGSMQIICD